jgi:hypothetical protein
MNLNLDDRLAPDAVQIMESELMRGDATCAGGDWKVCYSQEDADKVIECHAASRLPFVVDWPPQPGTMTRLGSGTGERGTLGPATLWRVEAHMHVPRYPWRLPEGTLLRSASDTVWWRLLANQFHKKILRLPVVIGNYHSHPGEQAEFRASPNGEEELRLVEELGVRLV